MSMWNSLQGHGDAGTCMVTSDADMVAMYRRNTHTDQISQAVEVHLHPISGVSNLQKELGTKYYILHSIFTTSFLLVEAFDLEIIDHIDQHFFTFEHQICNSTRCTSFSYDVYRVKGIYYNT